jgi:hypothetical protein
MINYVNSLKYDGIITWQYTFLLLIALVFINPILCVVVNSDIKLIILKILYHISEL